MKTIQDFIKAIRGTIRFIKSALIIVQKNSFEHIILFCNLETCHDFMAHTSYSDTIGQNAGSKPSQLTLM
jgi:hypothetical protein